MSFTMFALLPDSVVRPLPCFPYFQALLHPYFFSDPLPAHHTELPIPSRSTKKVRRAHQAREYNPEAPLEDSLVSPALLAPHAISKLD